MHSSKRPAPRSTEPSRRRRFVLLELPGWLILAVGVAYSASTSGGIRVVAFQLLLLSAAAAWLAGGRLTSLNPSSLLFGWAAGTLAMFNLLASASIGIFILPVTAFVAVILVLLLASRGMRPVATAVAGAAVAVLSQLLVLGWTTSVFLRGAT